MVHAAPRSKSQNSQHLSEAPAQDNDVGRLQGRRARSCCSPSSSPLVTHHKYHYPFRTRPTPHLTTLTPLIPCPTLSVFLTCASSASWRTRLWARQANLPSRLQAGIDFETCTYRGKNANVCTILLPTQLNSTRIGKKATSHKLTKGDPRRFVTLQSVYHG